MGVVLEGGNSSHGNKGQLKSESTSHSTKEKESGLILWISNALLFRILCVQKIRVVQIASHVPRLLPIVLHGEEPGYEARYGHVPVCTHALILTDPVSS